MVIDPRMLSSMGPEVINGQVADKALDLLDILNKVTGSQGFGNKTFSVLDGELSSDLSLGVYNIEADTDQRPWAADQVVYFQSTPQRLSQIQKTLNDNLVKIQDDISSNIGSLFDLIHKSKAEGGLDIEGQINLAKETLQGQSGLQELLSAGGDLENIIKNLLTNDAAIDVIVDRLFENFRLSISRLNRDIFALLDDGDNNYSNGSTDTARYLITSNDGTALVVDTVDQVFDIRVQKMKSAHEEQFGLGSWDNDIQDQTIFGLIGSWFQQGSLALSQDLINHIIDDKHLSEEDLAKFTKQGQFLALYDTPSFIQMASSYYGTTGDLYGTVTALYKDNLALTSPKYFKDERTVRDIIAGKNHDIKESNSSSIFRSAGDQIRGAGQGVIDLLGGGFSKLSRNDFEGFARGNPILLIEELEKRKQSASAEDLVKINDQLGKLRKFNSLKIDSLIRFYTMKHDRIKSGLEDKKQSHSSDEEFEDKIAELQQLKLGNVDDIDLYNKYPELALGETPVSFSELSLDSVTDVNLEVKNPHTALYATELLQANKMNANYSMRELPKAGADGSIPEETQMAPPLVSPTLLSGVVAAVGNQILYKAFDLLNNPDIPNEEWLHDQNKILKSIDDGIASGVLAADTTAGQQFLMTMKDAFKNVFKQFLINDLSEQKVHMDSAREAVEALTVLGTNSSSSSSPLNPNSIDSSEISTKLNQISQALDHNLLDGNNLIKNIGLGNIKKYLEQLTPNLQNQINNLTQQISQVEQGLIVGDLAVLNANLSQLRDLLAQNNDLLHGNDKIGQKFDHYVGEALSGLNAGALPPGQDPLDFLNSQSAEIIQNYKNSTIGYGNKVVNHLSKDSDENGDLDIIEQFKVILASDTALDLNNDGENDFKTIQNTINALGGLSKKMSTDLFGSEDPKPGNYMQQDIKRLIKLMYVMNMLEWGDWEYRMLEGDLSRYAVE